MEMTPSEKYLINCLKENLRPEQIRHFGTLTPNHQKVVTLKTWTEFFAFPGYSTGEAYHSPDEAYDALRFGYNEIKPMSAVSIRFYMNRNRKEESA